MVDPLNILPKLSNLLGGRDGPISLFPQNPFEGPESDAPTNNPPGNGPGADDPGLDTMPRGLEGRDSIPYGVAKQLDAPLPPAPPALPFPGGPPAPNAPNAPLATPSMGGNAQAAATGGPLPTTGGTAQPAPVGQPAIPSNPGSPLGQITQSVQSFVNLVVGTTTTTMARASDPNLPANPAATRPATANPVPPPAAAAQPAQTPAMPAQVGNTPQGAAGASAQPMGAMANPNAANPAAVMPTVRPGGTEAAQLPQQTQQTQQPQQPQGRTDAMPLQQQRPEGSLLDRLMSLLRPNAANTAAQGSTAPNSAAAAAQAAGTTAVAMPLAVAATQAPMDPRGNVLLAVNDRAGIQRADAVLAGTYTADGPVRRGLRRGSNVMSAHFSRLLMALGLAGPPVTMRGRDAEYELSVAMQWLFWLLAIVAYACLGFAVIAFLPAGSEVFGDSGRGWTTGFAFAGLFAAVGAWWFARRLSRRSAGDASDLERNPEED